MKVSIIIPVYNVEQYVEECLQSVANQTMTEGIECIIVDDCGPDNSAAIAKRFIDSYQGDIRFTFLQREKNGGLSAARNTGIRAATGEYVYFLDSDDYLVPSAIETLISIADRNGGVDLLPALYITNAGHHMDQFASHCDLYDGGYTEPEGKGMAKNMIPWDKIVDFIKKNVFR